MREKRPRNQKDFCKKRGNKEYFSRPKVDYNLVEDDEFVNLLGLRLYFST